MNIIIELSIDLNVCKNISEIKAKLDTILYKYNFTDRYFTYESEGEGKFIERNDCIMTILFEFNNKDIINFIRNIKKIPSVKIDSIYVEKKYIEYIYYSKRYLYFQNIENLKKINNSSLDNSNPNNIIQLLNNYYLNNYSLNNDNILG